MTDSGSNGQLKSSQISQTVSFQTIIITLDWCLMMFVSLSRLQFNLIDLQLLVADRCVLSQLKLAKSFGNMISQTFCLSGSTH